jgi:4-amino-4-deoxy-L-arabinose transferase-like glycosyltransferase
MKPSKLDFNPHYFQYGGFYIYSVALLLKLASFCKLISLKDDMSYYFLYPQEFGKFYIISRSLGVISVIISIFLIYLIGKEMYSKSMGLLWALLFTVSPGIVAQVHVMKPHIVGIPWCLAALYASMKILKIGAQRWYFLGGLSCGLAAGSTMYYVVVFVIGFIAHFMSINKKSSTFKAFSL